MVERIRAHENPIRRIRDFPFARRWETIVTSDRDQSTQELARDLRAAVAQLLAGWPLEEVELAAWEFALTGWHSGQPPLVEDYDWAYERYLQVLDGSNLDAGNRFGQSMLAALFDEFRNRVQFLQTRAADIRLSASLERLTAVSIERVIPVVEELSRILQTSDVAGALEKFEKDERGGFLVAVDQAIDRVGAKNPEIGAGLKMYRENPIVESTMKLAEKLPSEVAKKLAVAALLHLWEVARS